jgi:ribose/xylose/arabinose/galactoside ABC-type transport system permease subunit
MKVSALDNVTTAGEAGPPVGTRPAGVVARREWLGAQTRNLELGLALGIALVVLGVLRPQYLSAENLLVVAMQMSFIGMAAIGTAFLVISGSIDLSIGSNFALVGVAASMMAKVVHPALAMALAIGLGGAIGWTNGLLAWRIKLSPLIITLGTMSIVRGIVLLLTGGYSVRGVPRTFATLGQAKLLGVPSPILIFALVAVMASMILARTTVGRYVLALGGSRAACEAVGIPVRRLTLGVFLANGLIVGLAGVLAASRFGSASPSFGEGMELDVITAVVLGGVAFTGGEGNILGVLLAVALIGVINSGIVALGIDPDYAEIVKGAALIGAVSLDQFSHEARERLRKILAIHESA